jgi:hypothetical protein
LIAGFTYAAVSRLLTQQQVARQMHAKISDARK